MILTPALWQQLKSRTVKDLHKQPRTVPGCPGPLEIEAPQPAGDVDDFPDEIKPGDLARLEGFRGQFTGVDPAPRDFGLSVASVPPGWICQW
jgi:hypothetical protein